jgi:hypothetical protein
MPQVTTAIGEKEMLTAFEARVVAAANVLVGTYSLTEHKSCMTQLRYGRLNRVFELAGVACRSRAEALARKRGCVAATAQAPSARAVSRKSKRRLRPTWGTLPPSKRRR